MNMDNGKVLVASDPYLDLLKSAICASLYEESSWQLIEGPMQDTISLRKPIEFIIGHAKRAIIHFLRRKSLMLIRYKPYLPELREQGLDWPLFGFSMVGIKRLDNIHTCFNCIIADRIPGDFMETGVWRGGSTILMRALLRHHGITDRTVWCADSFAGLPSPNKVDQALTKISDFTDREFLKVSQEQVEANFNKFGLLDEQVRFLKGWFKDTLPSAPIDRLALLRLDGDLYESTMDALTNMYPKLSPGGFLVIDDYNSWAGCKQAVTDYRKSDHITAEIMPIDTHSSFWRVPLS